MNFTPAADPDEIKKHLHDIGLISIEEYYVQVKKLLKRQRQSANLTVEQIQKKLAENGFLKDDSTKNAPILYPRKRTSFSPVITRKRGKAIKKRTPSTSQVTHTETVSVSVVSQQPQPIDEDSVDYDQPLDLRLRTKSQ